MTHTPGPWRISGCQLGEKLLIEHGNEETFSPIIGSVYADGGKLPQAANAHLIAAAPELLEALEKAQAVIGDLVRYGNASDDEIDAYSAIKRAISKAEGKG